MNEQARSKSGDGRSRRRLPRVLPRDRAPSAESAVGRAGAGNHEANAVAADEGRCRLAGRDLLAGV